MPGDEGIGIGELSRQVRDVLTRFESLATRLENQFVRSDNFILYQRLVDQAIHDLQEKIKTFATSDNVKNMNDDIANKAEISSVKRLEARVDALEDDKKWLIRLVATFLILGTLGAVFAVNKAGGG